MKGLEYVAIDPGIAKDPKIALMAGRLRKDRFWVAGHFPAFFGEVAMHAHDGKIGEIPDDLLDEWAGGVRGWGVLVKEFLCENGTLRAWHRYNGRAIERLVEDRERKAEYRRKVRGKSKDSPGTKPGNVRKESEHNTETGTETSSPNGEEHHHQRAGVSDSIEEQVRELLEPHGAIPALDDAISRQRSRQGFIRQLWAVMNPEDGSQGPGGRPIPVEAVALALQDAETSMEGKWNGQWFRTCLANAAKRLIPVGVSTGDEAAAGDAIDRWLRRNDAT